MSVEVSEKFMNMLVVRYSAVLQAKEVQKELRRYSNKHYSTRKLKRELRKLHNEILTADPKEIPALRRRYLTLREQISKIVEARDADPTVQRLKGESRALREAVMRLDEAIVQELRGYGYEIKPIKSEEVNIKVRELIPEPRTEPVKSDKVEVAAAKPARGE